MKKILSSVFENNGNEHFIDFLPHLGTFTAPMLY